MLVGTALVRVGSANLLAKGLADEGNAQRIPYGERRCPIRFRRHIAGPIALTHWLGGSHISNLRDGVSPDPEI
ncbi:hypothetical protein ABT341_30410 [Pseudonocardia alni]|uniref:hypothetical protein n=1 Tax=Pseudonocardia alni TaxID=33907 RepID=UPI00331F9314